MHAKVKENLLVSPFLVFFLIYSVQATVAVLSFQREIVRRAGYDAWMTVLITGLLIHIVIWLLYKILNRAEDDVIGIHRKLFGKWFGGVLSCFVILFFILISLTLIRAYIGIIQVWVFPHMSTWVFAGGLLLLVYAFVSGGFRSVTGVCFLSMIYITPLLVLTFYFPLEFATFSNLLPIMTHPVTDILAATKQMVPNYIGFQLLLIFYPFIKKAKKSQKWAHMANLFTTTIFLLLALIAFVFYSKQQLLTLPWATLTFFQIVEFPWIDRFAVIGVVWWLFALLPNVCLSLWCSSRGLKRLFSMNQRHALIVILLMIFVCNGLFTDESDIKMLVFVADNSGFYFFLLYIPLLFIVQLLIENIKGKRKQSYPHR